MKNLLLTIILSILYTLCNAQSGANDPTFNPGSGANNTIVSTCLQSDGKIIIGGNFTSYNGTARNRIARLNSDGSIDLSFNPGTGITASFSMSDIRLQSDGKIIICGGFTSYNGTVRNRIARINTDGSLDASFNPGTGADVTIRSLAIQNDGKIIIGGPFTSYNGISRNCIARLNTDGSLDASFNPGTGANIDLYCISIQNDGKIIIGGSFTNYNGTPRNRVARLNTDGSIDLTFNPGTGADDVIRSSAIQNDGKIIIGGHFLNYNGTTRNRIARLNNDGSLDVSFNPGTGANNFIIPTAIQSDGKIIIGGGFSDYNGTSINRIARLNTNGSLDASFNTGFGASSSILSTSIQSDGNIIIGGSFSNYDGVSRNSIARIIGPASILPLQFITFNGNLENEKVKLTWETSMEENVKGFQVLKSNDLKTFYKIGWLNAFNTLGKNSYEYIDNSAISGNVFYKLLIEDIDGKTKESNIVKIFTRNNSEVSIFPNPCINQLTINSSIDEQVKIINNLGQVQQTFKITSGANELDISILNVGVYFIQFQNSKTIQFNKQ